MSHRGQANLIGFAVGLILISTATTAGVIVAEQALAGADTDRQNAHIAHATATAMVSPSAPYTISRNTLDRDQTEKITRKQLEAMVPALTGRHLQVYLDRQLLIGAEATPDAMVRRRVRISYTIPRTDTMSFDSSTQSGSRRYAPEFRYVLTDRPTTVSLYIQPAPRQTVTSIRVADRVIRYNPNGLAGHYQIATPQQVPVEIAFKTVERGPGQVALQWNQTIERSGWIAVGVGRHE
jgi:hypothetical protein